MTLVSSIVAFARERWGSWTVAAVLGALVWAGHVTHDVAMSHPGFLTGWVLVVLMVFLTIYNLRKKLDFLPGMFSSRKWLWAHLVGGYLSVWVFVLHVGLRLPEGWLESGLWLLFWGVIASGVFGHYISRRFPPLLADRRQEVLFERVPVLIAELRARAEAAVLRAAREGDSTNIPDFYRERLSDFLAGPRHGWQHILDSARPLEDLLRGLDNLGRLCSNAEQEILDDLRETVEAKDHLDFQYIHQWLLKVWLIVHVPMAYSLVVVMTLHVVLAYAFGGIN